MVGSSLPHDPAADIIKRTAAAATRLSQVAATVGKLATPTNGTQAAKKVTFDPNSSQTRATVRLKRELKREPTEIEVLKELLEKAEATLIVRNSEHSDLDHKNTDLEQRIERYKEEIKKLERAQEELRRRPPVGQALPKRRIWIPLIAILPFLLGICVPMLFQLRSPMPAAAAAKRYRFTSVGYVEGTHYIRVGLEESADGFEMPKGIESDWKIASDCTVATITTYTLQANGIVKLLRTVPSNHNPLEDWAEFTFPPKRESSRAHK